jgi:hypothetical protein
MNVLRFFCPRSPEPVDEDLCALMRPWLFGLVDGPPNTVTAVPVAHVGVMLDARFGQEVAPWAR